MEKEKPRKSPALDLSECTDCESCINLAPSIFKRNEETGQIEVAESADYPESLIQEVMSMCPGRCIVLEEVER